MTGRTIGLVCVLGMLTMSAANAAAPPAPGPLWLPLPGGVADAAGTTGYVANPEGRVEALDLATGRVLWESSVPCHPLALVGGRLVGWVPAPPLAKSSVEIAPQSRPDSPPPPSNRFCLVVLDAADGRQVWTSKVVTLPEWADVHLSHAHTFAVTAEPSGMGVLLRWEATAWHESGWSATRKLVHVVWESKTAP